MPIATGGWEGSLEAWGWLHCGFLGTGKSPEQNGPSSLRCPKQLKMKDCDGRL